MFAVRFRPPSDLPERIFAKLAKIPVSQRVDKVYPFASATWPKAESIGSTGLWDQEPVAPLSKPAARQDAQDNVPILKTQPKRPALPQLCDLTATPKAKDSSHVLGPLNADYASQPILPSQEFKTVTPIVVDREFRLPNREMLRANKVVELQRRHIDEVNHELPFGYHVMAWALIPAACWQGANGTFMTLACDFFPASAANTMLLPVTRKGEAQLQLPLNPFNPPTALVEEATRKLSALQKAFAQEHQLVLESLQRGDLSVLANRPVRKKKFTDDLRALAQELAIRQFSKTHWEHHQKTFGNALAYETPISP